MKLGRYPLSAEGTPLDMMGGVLTDASGNGGQRVTERLYGPDNGLIDVVGLVLMNSDGSPLMMQTPVSSISELAAAPQFGSIYLGVANRGGVFKWDPANRSDDVAADTRQAIFIAPSSDLTGASGAWVRQFDQMISFRWFDPAADWDGSAGTDDAPAFLAAIALLEHLSLLGVSSFSSIYRGAPALYIPKGWYRCSVTLSPRTTVRMFGDGGRGWGAPTRISFPAGVDGVVTQAYNTSGETTVVSPTYAGAVLYLTDIYFSGGYNGSNPAAVHGLHLKQPIECERCTFEGFQGAGLYANATIGGGVTNEGNASVAHFRSVDFLDNGGDGAHVDGADANIISFTDCQAINNAGWGFNDLSFLGNNYNNCHTSLNALGPYQSTNQNARSVYMDCYSESNQPPSNIKRPALVIGGQHAAGMNVDASWITGGNDDYGGTLEGGAWQLNARTNPFGSFFISSTAQQSLIFQQNGDYRGRIRAADTRIYYEVPAGYWHDFRVNDVNIATLDVTGLNLAAIPLKVNGNQVVGARGASLPADATDLASAIALVNAIKARLKTTGGHGLVAD